MVQGWQGTRLEGVPAGGERAKEGSVSGVTLPIDPPPSRPRVVPVRARRPTEVFCRSIFSICGSSS